MEELEDKARSELESMTWFRVHGALSPLIVSLHTFEGNCKDFFEHAHKLCVQPESLALMGMQNHDLMSRELHEVARLLHNVAAASKSLVDHTRRVHDSIAKLGAGIPEYQQQIDMIFANDPTTQFIHNLRNYFLHVEPTNAAMRFSLKQGRMQRSLTLSVSELNELKEWNVAARKFLASAGSHVDIVRVVADYRNNVKAFMLWLDKRVHEVNANEQAAFRAKQEVVLLDQLEMGLRNASASVAGTTNGELLAFWGLLRSAEFDELSELPERTGVRAERAVCLLRDHVRLSNKLERDIREWYEKR